jgi:RNA 3'-terminal phosphate cyclase (ATP)
VSDEPRVVDGSDGGGQVLRTALSLATLAEVSVRVENVRGGRPEPGLKPQHRAAVRLLADYSDAAVTGDEVGAETVTFRPGTARQTSLSAAIPTAGSVTLLFDALLPVAAAAAEPVSLTAAGGTHVKWAPTLAYYRTVKLPLLAAAGLDATVERGAVGFYPAGGGEARLRVEPSALSPLDLRERGALDRVEVYSTASASLTDAEVADRQAEQANDRLVEAGLVPDVRTVEHVETRSPGSSLLLCGVYDRARLGAGELGERGVPSETVADRAVDRFLDVHDGPGAVDPHMADQLVGFLALAGGRVRIPRVTDHVETNLAVLQAFDYDVDVEPAPDGGHELVAPTSAAIGSDSSHG